ncbi:MAG TPA: hypothetical protein VMG82_08600 [Candidatus Sulfotelmatobacter sp.]|nr:hypothetical protein [Candidatus Sulfotelmatobacter sp.]
MNKRIYSRYDIVRGQTTLWRGNVHEKGSHFLELVITSNEFNSTQGVFQVLAFQGIGAGIVDGELKTEDNTNVLVDRDFNGLDAALNEVQKITAHAQSHGFKPLSLIGQFQYEQNRRESKKP